MKANISTIQPGEGLGDIKFGMSREALKRILGEPDEIESTVNDEDDTDITESWHYDNIEVSVSFEKIEGWKLCTIAVSAPEATLKGHKIIGLSKSELTDILKSMGIKNLVLEDWSSDESPDYVSLTSEEQEIVFWLEDDEVMDIQWGPLFIDEDTIKWPMNGHGAVE